MIRKKIGLILLISLLVNMLVFGQIQPAVSGTFGSEFQVNTTTNQSQEDAAIAMDSDGNFVICWEDDDAGTNDVKAQRYGYPYTAQGGEITVASGLGEQQNPSIAMDSSGNFVVVWEDDSGGNFDVKAQRYDSDGTAQGSVITVASGAGDQDMDFEVDTIAMDPSGNFVVVWEDDGGVANDDVKFQRYNSSGVAQGGITTVASGLGNQDNGAVAMDSSGSFVVVWEDDAATNDDVKFQRYDSGGVAQGGVVTVASGLLDQHDVAVAMDSAGDFVIGWEDGAAGNDDIKVRRYDSGGVLLGSTITVASGAGDQEDVAVAMDSSGSFIVAWEDGSGATEEVYAQRYNSQGVPLGSSFQANTYTAGNQSDTNVALDENGGSVIVWESPGQDTSSDGIFAQRYSNLSTTWYFAEGYTGEGFDEWLTLQNPNSVAASVTITYMFRDATTQTENKTVAANSRETVSVNADVGSNKEVSMKVVADQPIIAERPMYFNYQGKWQGGHNTIGATSTSTDWYFAEGYTGTGFEEWLTLQNPTGTDATATITYYYRGGATPTVKTKTIAANSRETVNVNSDVGTDKEVSIKVESTQAIIAERPMYFNYQDQWQGGHNTIGVTTPVNQWFFAEGYTGDGFAEWLTLQNPNATAATATVTYYYRGGATPTVKTKTIAANSRETIDVNTDAGTGKEVSIKVSSTNPIIAERPMYFSYQGIWQGGHDTIGFGP